VGEDLVQPPAVGDNEDPVPDDVPEDIYALALATVISGFWLLHIKGNLKHRIELLGAEKDIGLTENQRRLKEAALMLKTAALSEGMRQGPLGRPAMFNGAFVYVTKQHACCLGTLLRSHGFEPEDIQSKHIIVSDELLADVTISLSAQPEGAGREAFQLRRAGEVSCALWMPEEEEGEEDNVVLEGVTEGLAWPPSASRDGVRWPLWRRHPAVRASLKKLTAEIEETERLLAHWRLRGPEGLDGLAGELLVSRNPERLMVRLKVVGDSTYDKWWSRQYDPYECLNQQNMVLNKVLHVGLKVLQKALYGFPLPGGRELGLGQSEVPLLKRNREFGRGPSEPIEYNNDPRPRAVPRPVEATSNWQPTLPRTSGSEIGGGGAWQ